MTFLLGIDTGGTYTDGVLMDARDQRVVARAKALTTYDDLAVGVRRCLEALPLDGKAGAIGGVALSTTLATNAIVEGRGCDVGLLLIGQPIEGEIPARMVECLQGGHDVKGLRQAELDPGAVEAAVERLRGKVGAVAVSGYFSIRNPEHEEAVRETVRSMLQVPVVCAHQLTTSLGFRERTVTAVLNARLIPLIVHLIESIRQVLRELHLEAPLMVVKGDGTLMGEAVAREKPIDTILSGPAASIIGATALAGRTEAVVVDMGGTTTDIAILQEGRPRINPEGAVVGDWLTRVEAAAVYTCGLGGDSRLRVDDDGKVLIGPQKALPLSRMAAEFPYLAEEIREQARWSGIGREVQATDAFHYVGKTAAQPLTPVQAKVVGLLRDGPHTAFYVYERLRAKGLSALQALVEQGLLFRIAMTPTDLLHAAGEYTAWDTRAACLGAELLAAASDRPTGLWIRDSLNVVVDGLCRAILKSLLLHEGYAESDAGNWLRLLQDKLLAGRTDHILQLRPGIRYPIIALGAPAASYLPAAAARLGAGLILPEHAEVANAVGAASGKIVEKINILIRSGAKEGVVLHAPWGRSLFASVPAAQAFALAEGQRWAEEAAGRSGAENIRVVPTLKEFRIKPEDGSETELHVETRIELVAVGRPGWSRE